jgi:hypothetical protein
MVWRSARSSAYCSTGKYDGKCSVNFQPALPSFWAASAAASLRRPECRTGVPRPRYRGRSHWWRRARGRRTPSTVAPAVPGSRQSAASCPRPVRRRPGGNRAARSRAVACAPAKGLRTRGQRRRPCTSYSARLWPSDDQNSVMRGRLSACALRNSGVSATALRWPTTPQARPSGSVATSSASTALAQVAGWPGPRRGRRLPAPGPAARPAPGQCARAGSPRSAAGRRNRAAGCWRGR